MESCTFNNLQSGSRTGIILAVLAVAGIAGIAGGLGGWFYATSTATPDTIINVSVSADFSVTFNQSGVVLYPANNSYNCSIVEVLVIKASANEFDEVMAYMKAHPEYFFSADNITDVTGKPIFQTGLDEMFLTNEMFGFGMDPRMDAKMDGHGEVLDYGNYVTMLFFGIGIYIDGNPSNFQTYMFGFVANSDFIHAMSTGKANYSTFNDAMFIRGPDNALAINNLNVDLDDADNSLANVVFNGESLAMPISSVF